MSERDGDFEIYTMRADGSDDEQVTNESADDFNPSWSPDGRQLLFNSDADGRPRHLQDRRLRRKGDSAHQHRRSGLAARVVYPRIRQRAIGPATRRFTRCGTVRSRGTGPTTPRPIATLSSHRAKTDSRSPATEPETSRSTRCAGTATRSSENTALDTIPSWGGFRPSSWVRGL